MAPCLNAGRPARASCCRACWFVPCRLLNSGTTLPSSTLYLLQASESQLLQSLRREMESIEQRLDEERAAHIATRKASGAASRRNATSP